MTASLLLLSGLAWASKYDIRQEWGERVGSFFVTSGGVKINDGTTLSRKHILLNDPTCPVEILSHAANYLNDENKFECTSSLDCAYGALIYLHVKNPIVAIDVRTSLFDVFGGHIATLRMREIQDLNPGRHDIGSAWDSDYATVEGLMVTATYVVRVLLADGTQWTYNVNKLLSALSILNLKEETGGDDVE